MKIRLLCNWCSSQDLINLWQKLLNPEYGIELVSNFSEEIDWFVIINKPQDSGFIPSKTFLFQMEPHMRDHPEIWGADWASPSRDIFYRVFDHTSDFNPVEWHLNIPIKKIYTTGYLKLEDVPSMILSNKYYDPGHKLRVDFAEYLLNQKFPIHIYGGNKLCNRSNYLPPNDKRNGLISEKYHIAVENHSYPYYATEKLYDGLIMNCLVFYWGCPNISDLIPKDSYVWLPLDESFEECKRIIETAMKEDWHEQRRESIRKARDIVLKHTVFDYILVNS